MEALILFFATLGLSGAGPQNEGGSSGQLDVQHDCEEWMEWDPVSSTCFVTDMKLCLKINFRAIPRIPYISNIQFNRVIYRLYGRFPKENNLCCNENEWLVAENGTLRCVVPKCDYESDEVLYQGKCHNVFNSTICQNAPGKRFFVQSDGSGKCAQTVEECVSKTGISEFPQKNSICCDDGEWLFASYYKDAYYDYTCRSPNATFFVDADDDNDVGYWSCTAPKINIPAKFCIPDICNITNADLEVFRTGNAGGLVDCGCNADYPIKLISGDCYDIFDPRACNGTRGMRLYVNEDGLGYCDCEEWMEWDPVSSTCVVTDMKLCLEINEINGPYPKANTLCCNENEWLVVENGTIRCVLHKCDYESDEVLYQGKCHNVFNSTVCQNAPGKRLFLQQDGSSKCAQTIKECATGIYDLPQKNSICCDNGEWLFKKDITSQLGLLDITSPQNKFGPRDYKYTCEAEALMNCDEVKYEEKYFDFEICYGYYDDFCKQIELYNWQELGFCDRPTTQNSLTPPRISVAEVHTFRDNSCRWGCVYSRWRRACVSMAHGKKC